MLPNFPNVTTQLEVDSDIDLNDLKSSVLSNKLVFLKWIKTTERELRNEIQQTKKTIFTESKKESNYVDLILKEQKLTTKDKNTKQCIFSADEIQCTKLNLPFSNYCNEHISNNKDQHLFKRCSFKISTNNQCTNSTLNLQNKSFCQKHLASSQASNNSLKVKNNENTIDDLNKIKTKRKYVKNKNSQTENKPKKTRKKKENTNDVSILNESNNVINNLICKNDQITNIVNDPSKSLTNYKPQSFSYEPNTTNSNNLIQNSCYQSNLTESNYYTTIADNNLNEAYNSINLIPNSLNHNENRNINNLNQIPSLNQSEDSLVASMVNHNEDLSSVPFGELSEMLGKIPDDAFNDLFMENLSSEDTDLRSINNGFDQTVTDVNSLEPSISNQTFTTAINFKSNNSYFGEENNPQNNLSLNNNIIYNQPAININNGNSLTVSQSELICYQNNLIQNINNENQQVKVEAINNTNQINSNNLIPSLNTNYNNDMYTVASQITNIQETYNAYGNVVDYNKLQNHIPFKNQNINANYSNTNACQTPPPPYDTANQNYLQNGPNGNFNPSNTYTLNVASYTNGSNLFSNQTNHLINSNVNNTQLLNEQSNQMNQNSNLIISQTCNSYNLNNSENYSINNSNTIKNELQDKNFDMYNNHKNTYTQNSYSNIYDSLPSFQSNNVKDKLPSISSIVNGSMPSLTNSPLPSFSVMVKKNRIESR